MSFPRLQKLPSVQNVAANQTAFIDLPIGRKYLSLWLNYKTNANQATIESDLSLIRLKINGKVQWELTAKELIRLINIPNGVAFVAGYVPVFFCRPWMRSRKDERITGLYSAAYTSVVLEVAIASGASSPVLDCYAELEDSALSGETTNPPLIFKYYKTPQVVGAASTLSFNNLCPKSRGALERIHILSNSDTASASVTNVTEKIDSFVIHDAIPSALNTALLAARKITIGTFHATNSLVPYTIAHNNDANIDSVVSLANVQNHELAVTFGAAATYNFIFELIGIAD